MAANWLANTVIALSAIAAALALLDFFLSDRQKAWTQRTTLNASRKLDELKRLPLADWWRQGGLWQWTVFILCGGFFLYAHSLPHPSGVDPIPGPPIYGYVLVLGASAFLARGVIKYVLPIVAKSPASVGFWLFPFVVGAAFAFGLYGITHYPSVPGTLNMAFFSGILAFIASIGVLAWIVAVLPLALIYLLAAVLAVAEFVVRRVAQYPRGPVLALSVLIGGYRRS